MAWNDDRNPPVNNKNKLATTKNPGGLFRLGFNERSPANRPVVFRSSSRHRPRHLSTSWLGQPVYLWLPSTDHEIALVGRPTHLWRLLIVREFCPAHPGMLL